MSNIEYNKKFIEAVKILINANNKYLKFNQKKKGVIQELNEDGTVNLTINDELYENVEVRAGLLPFVGEVVRLEMPNNNTKEMYVDTAKNTENINLVMNIDGGSAVSIYTLSQNIDRGNADD